jgi:hypothetical protein
MDPLTLRTVVVLVSWVVGAFLAVRVLKSRDPVFFKAVLVALCVIPVVGPLVVYWVSNFPSRLHPDSQARFKEAVNTYGRWRTEEDKKTKD